MLSPNSVSTSCRVLRCINRSPNAFSSSDRRRDKVDLGSPVRSEARVKLPASATCAKRIRSLAYNLSDDTALTPSLFQYWNYDNAKEWFFSIFIWNKLLLLRSNKM